MHVCVVSLKECWQDGAGRWLTDGGFPLQMAAIATLFETMTLVVVGVPARRGGMLLPEGAEVVPLRRPVGTDWRRKLSVLLGLRYYLGTIARNSRAADVMHIPLPGDLPLLGLLVALGQRRPLVARYGGSWAPTATTTLMNRITRQLMRTTAGGRNVMFATGCGSRAPSPNMHWVFATAISEAEVASVRPDLARAPQSPRRFVYVGRLSPEKGLRQLVRAVASVARGSAAGQAPLVLDLIGDGPERRALTELVSREGLEGVIRFAGQLARTPLLEALAHADVAVLPSFTEGFPKARLDAMLCGTPVITSDVGFAREVVGRDGERGWVVRPGDADDLARAIEIPLHQQLDWPGVRARCRAYAETYTLEAWAREIGERCAAQWKCSLTAGKLRTL